MDPLSVVGGVASIVQLIETSQKVVTYLHTVKSAPEERNDLLIELSSLLGLLISFKCRAEAATTEDPWLQAVKCLGQVNGPLEQIEDSLGALTKKLIPRNGLRGIARDCVWSLEKKEVHSILSKIERLKSSLSLALANDFIGLYDQIFSNLSSVQDNVSRIGRDIDLVQRNLHDQERREVEAWTSDYDPMPRHMELSARRCQPTGSWFFQEPAMQDWLYKNDGFIWCPGIPGE